jgi:hypothetical protein
MINVAGDFLRAFWFSVNSVVILSGGQLPDKSALCQISGYFMSMGYELTGICHSIDLDNGHADNFPSLLI